jgi:signal peptidase I
MDDIYCGEPGMPPGFAEGHDMTTPLKISYMGPSMQPTMKAGDILEVIPYQDRKIRIGDVVVFSAIGRDHKVVHRVIDLGPEGATTQGDNNVFPDTHVVPEDVIIGRVASLQRGNRKIRVHGGRSGWFFGSKLRAGNRINRYASKIFRPVYHRVARSGLIRNTLTRWVKPRTIIFKRDEETESQLVWGRWVIGRRRAGQNKWMIRRPFLFIIDESHLMDDNVT